MTTWRTHHKRRRRAIERAIAASAELRLDVLVDVLADLADFAALAGDRFLPIFPRHLLRPGPRLGFGTLPPVAPIVLVDYAPPAVEWREIEARRVDLVVRMTDLDWRRRYLNEWTEDDD